MNQEGNSMEIERSSLENMPQFEIQAEPNIVVKKRNKIIVKFGLSRKKHLPVIWVEGITNFYPYRLDIFLKCRGLALTKIGDEHVAIEKNGIKFFPPCSTEMQQLH